MKTLLSKSQVENLLPQKAPFAMVDGLVELNREAFSTLTIAEDNLLVNKNHFSEAVLL